MGRHTKVRTGGRRRRRQVPAGARDQRGRCVVPQRRGRRAECGCRLFPPQSASAHSCTRILPSRKAYRWRKDNGRHRQRRHASRERFTRCPASIDTVAKPRKTTFLTGTRNLAVTGFLKHTWTPGNRQVGEAAIYGECLRRDDTCFAISGRPIPVGQAAQSQRVSGKAAGPCACLAEDRGSA